MINTILNEIVNGYSDSLLSKVINEEKKDYFVKNNSTEIFHITSSYNQKNNEYNNVSTIDIGECEDILREKYHISSDETIILFKTDFYIKDFLVPITEYEIFNPLTKEKLDLNYCYETKMKIYTPIVIEEEYLYKYDPNSEYYKDKCYPNPSECGNDDILLERKIESNPLFQRKYYIIIIFLYVETIVYLLNIIKLPKRHFVNAHLNLNL